MNYGIWNKILNKIKHFQNQPEDVKARVVWLLAIVITAIVVALWLGFFRDFEFKKVSGVNNSFAKIIKEFKDNIENKIKQAQPNY